MSDAEPLRPMAMGPRRGLADYANVGKAWIRSRRGRTLGFSALVLIILLALLGVTSRETIASSYKSATSSYHLPSWRPSLPSLPSFSINNPLPASNTTRELENGEIEHTPAGLEKATPNFHLIMSALQDSPEFCRTSMSAMILNYPPPTVINLFQKFDNDFEREKARVHSILKYLNEKKLVGDEDLVLVVDGQDTWFQLPSDVVIRQYQNIVADSKAQLLDQYGVDKMGRQKFNTTIVFGAEKECEGEELACKYAPESILPPNIYGTNTGKAVKLTAARYLDAGMMMGPAKHLRALYEVAVKKFDAKQGGEHTTQSVFSTIFGEQQLARGKGKRVAFAKASKPSAVKAWTSWFGGVNKRSPVESQPTQGQQKEAPPRVPQRHNYEFAIGLDYTHTLFQSLLHTAPEELVPIVHDNSSDLTAYQRPDTPNVPLDIPPALRLSKPPFWVPDFQKHNPSPNDDESFIKPLTIQKDLDALRPRETGWHEVQLIQNTYTGAIPAIFHLDLASAPKPKTKTKPKRTPADSKLNIDTSPASPAPNNTPKAPPNPKPKFTWTSLWYSTFERALLRSYFRLLQSPLGYHIAAVGGDMMWDRRGGRGGVWTGPPQNGWFAWGEVDGVCGHLEQLKRTFGDGKGVWLHEKEGGAEDARRREEEEWRKKVEEMGKEG